MLELDNVTNHAALGLSDDQVIDMYRKMLLARKLDERVWALNRQGRVPFVVSVAGHEGTRSPTGHCPITATWRSIWQWDPLPGTCF